ncbi:MAG: 2Fe-2S iron-sulfur cluster binding domain-containing protein [Bdellovibrionaceae bacterium]|jgi:ferredoxin|nr:2Fe-2S iron-sulfur cluster binding domain-containing protein [Pseudobdellovibrionaceae bacterium]
MKIKVLPTGQELDVEAGLSLLDTLLRQGIRIRSLCKGVPSCAECRIKVVEGRESLLPPNAEEIRLIGNASYIDGRRLACQCYPYGPVTIDISEHLQAPSVPLKGIKGFHQQTATHAKVRTLVLDESESNPTPDKTKFEEP